MKTMYQITPEQAAQNIKNHGYSATKVLDLRSVASSSDPEFRARWRVIFLSPICQRTYYEKSVEVAYLEFATHLMQKERILVADSRAPITPLH